MTRTQRACLTGAAVGAAIGATVAYLYMTDDGAQQRDDVWRAVDRASRDVGEAGRLWHDLVDVWTTFQDDRRAAISSTRS